MTIDPIAAKAEALWAKRPELRPLGLKYNHLGWWLCHYSVMDDDAHMLIEAACWRALQEHSWRMGMRGAVLMYKDAEGGMDWIGVDEPSLTEALIAACMEAKQ